jgi:subtilisin family serine protease
MARTARRPRLALRLESLEVRTLLSVASGTLGNAPSWSISDPSPATSVLIGFHTGTSAKVESAILKAAHGQIIATYPDGPVLVQTPSVAARNTALTYLPRFMAVRYAEPDSSFHVDATVPNDPGYAAQWGLESSNNVDIDATQAWSVTTGNPATIVAVIDSGIDTTHPEFAGRLWTNTVEATGQPGVDNDGDGFAGDIHGWNFLANTADISDDNGHGTHVAGILAATGNNGTGVAGVNWNAQIMPLKFIGSDGNGSVDDAVRAIYYAVNHGARVINASWGGGDHIQALTDAISFANSRNVVFVTAAGNEGVNNGVKRSFPADDRLPNVISVAAIDNSGRLASFSNFGATTVDLAAPGVNIRSTVPGGYATYSGTSMSAPYVSGVISLVVGLHPELTAQQLVQRILDTTKPLVHLKGKVITGGMVDAANAVSDSYAAAHSAVSTNAHKAKKPVVTHIVKKQSHVSKPVKVKAFGEIHE